jgi:OPA family glycerol-3-phosphate transporter-like MFS transporter
VALIGVQALNLVPKNAAGTAAGFVGLFGYLVGDAIFAKILMGAVSQSSGWNAAFWMFVVAGVVGALLCATTWKKENSNKIVPVL